MNRTEYIGKLNALYVGDKNCLEELITVYDEKNKEIERLNENNQAMQEEMARTWKKLDEKENIIEEDKKIEKVNTYVLCDYDFKNKDDDNNLIATNIIDKAFEEYSHKINEIIDKLNEMGKE